ncbi:MAG TPA: helix-turn-helix domain-containing protein, partial [Nannocystis sp.]
MRDGQGIDVEDVPVHSPVEDAGEASVGERLRQARTAAGLTLEQVSAGTRIRVPLLRELEADRLGPASSAVYTRGHIRAIAAVVGVDPAPIVRLFDDRVGATAPSLPVVAEPVPAPRRPTGSLSVPVSAPPDRTEPRWLVASLAGVTVLVALLA